MDEHAIATRSWVSKVPIGLGLCPWAGKSNNRGLLNIINCESECPEDVAQLVENEVELLTREGTPPLSTTLVVCPHVKAWKEDFNEFDEFVRVILRQRRNDTHIMQHVTFVAFHPSFCRWYGIPEGFGVGSVVDSHYGTIGQKSIQTTPATIIETNNKAFGLRKVKVRFHDTTLEGLGNRQEQYVPTDWIDFTKNEETCQALPLLPDNSMHQSPYPTIHIITNRDLASTSVRDVSRVKRLNAQRMMKLGWEGVEHHFEK